MLIPYFTYVSRVESGINMGNSTLWLSLGKHAVAIDNIQVSTATLSEPGMSSVAVLYCATQTMQNTETRWQIPSSVQSLNSTLSLPSSHFKRHGYLDLTHQMLSHHAYLSHSLSNDIFMDEKTLSLSQGFCHRMFTVRSQTSAIHTLLA